MVVKENIKKQDNAFMPEVQKKRWKELRRMGTILLLQLPEILKTDF